MRLLVSVQNQCEAEAALAGGADIIDAKNPELGPLGAVSIACLREIHAAGRSRPVTAALGDAQHEVAVEAMARVFAGAGASMVKVGFAGVTSLERAASLLSAAVAGASAGSHGACGVVAVAYADAAVVAGLDRHHVLEAAIRCGAEGVLLDTADKAAAGLSDLLSPKDIAAWTAEAHQAGLLVALAGKLTPSDFPMVKAAGADIAGVRGAACEGGRAGTVSADRVRVLRALCEVEPLSRPAEPAQAGRSTDHPDRATRRTPTGCCDSRGALEGRARP